jgi:hypothetical protein
MRRLAFASMLVLAAAAVVAGASAHDRALPPSPVSCGSAKQFSYVFWPTGHPAIPQINFPAYPVPHMEVYRGSDPTYPNPALVGVANAQAGGGFAASCKAAKLGRTTPLAKAGATTQAGLLVCSFPRAPLHEVVKTPGGYLWVSAEPGKAGAAAQVEVSATFKSAGSTLSYDRKACKLAAAPKPPPLMQYSFDGLSTTFNGPGGAPVTETFKGTACTSDIRSGWAITFNLFGADHPNTVDFRAANPASVGGLQGGGGAAQAQLQLNAGPPATMTLIVNLTGSYSGLSINPSQVPITATPVSSC